jgi:hypothetical protein
VLFFALTYSFLQPELFFLLPQMQSGFLYLNQKKRKRILKRETG